MSELLIKRDAPEQSLIHTFRTGIVQNVHKRERRSNYGISDYGISDYGIKRA